MVHPRRLAMMFDPRHDDILEIELVFLDDPLDGIEGLESMLAIAKAIAPEVAPTELERSRGRKLTRANLQKALDDGSVAVSDPAGRARHQWESGRFARPQGRGFYRAGLPLDVEPTRVVSAVEAMAALCPVAYGYAHSQADRQLGSEPSGSTYQTKELWEAYWLTVVGRTMINKLGKRRVANAPAAEHIALEGGAVLLRTSPSANDTLEPGSRDARVELRCHLVPSVDPREERERLARRAEQLAPVESNWPEHHRELFEWVLERWTSLAERRARCIELNHLDIAYHSIPFDEWPEDAVEDAEAAWNELFDLADGFEIGMGAHVEALKGGVSDALPAFDRYAYERHRDLRRLRDKQGEAAFEERVVRGLGAWVIHRFVDELDGQYLPRRDPRRSGVRIGDRVWQPILRAERYFGDLEDRDRVLENSMEAMYAQARGARR